MAQTSVEFMIEILRNYDGNLVQWLDKEIAQAKEMHKEETMDAFQAGKWDWSTHVNHGKHSMDPAEYYNKTFNND